jgi:hypothetical protein
MMSLQNLLGQLSLNRVQDRSCTIPSVSQDIVLQHWKFKHKDPERLRSLQRSRFDRRPKRNPQFSVDVQSDQHQHESHTSTPHPPDLGLLIPFSRMKGHTMTSP